MVTTKDNNDLTIKNSGCKLGAAQKNNIDEMNLYFQNLEIKSKTVYKSPNKGRNKFKKIMMSISHHTSLLPRISRGKKRRVHIDCDDVIEDTLYLYQRDNNKYMLLPNTRDECGNYYHDNRVYVDALMEYIPPHELPPKIINDFKFGIQLGVEYKSNSAGDGPAIFSKMASVLFLVATGVRPEYWFNNFLQYYFFRNYHLTTFNELFVYLESKLRRKECEYIERNLIKSITKKNCISTTFYMDTFNQKDKYIIMFFTLIPIILMWEQFIHKLGHGINFQYYANINLIHLFFIFILRLVLTQLGVTYTSNNAGDGPNTNTYGSRWHLQATNGMNFNFEEIKTIVQANIKEPKAYHIAETLMLFIYDLSRSKTKTDIFVSVGRFLREHYQGVLLQDATEKIKDCFVQIFHNPNNLQSEDNVFEYLRDYLDNFDMLKQSPMYKKIYRFIMYILSYTLFRDKNCTYESFGYTAMEAAAMRLKFHAGPDMVYTILDTITFLGEKGFEIYKNGFSIGLLQSSSKYEKFITECNEIMDITRNMNQLEVLDESELLNRIENLLQQGEDILRCRNMVKKFEYDFLKRYVDNIRSIKLDILSFRGATRSRKAPLSILFNGDSGIGKSTILKTTIAAYCNKTGEPNEDAYIYTRNSVEEYWNNFRTYMHTLILDDVAFRNPNMKDSSSVDEIIQIVNDINFVPDQASIEDKGRIPFRCKFVVATTNTKHLNAYHYFSCPSAVQRRFPYIVTPSVKSQYKHDETGMLDPTKVPEMEDDSFPDYWDFKVELVTPTPLRENGHQSMAKFTVLHEKLNMEGYIDWLYEAIDKHLADTTKVQESLTQLKKVQLCDICKKPLKYCKCALQSASMTLLTFGYWYAWHTVCQEAIYAFFILFLTNITPARYASSVIMRYTNNPIVAKIMFNRISQTIKDKVGKPELLVYFTGIAGALFMLWKTYRSFNKDLQGANQSKFDEDGMRPVPRDSDDNENVWYKNDFELTTADVTRTILSSKSLSHAALINIISKNCVSLRFDISLSTHRASKAFAISGQMYLTNNHCVPECDNIKVTLVQQSLKEGVNSNVSFTLNQVDVIRMPEKDLCLVIIRCLPPRKNLIEYFPPKSYAANTDGFYVKRELNGSMSMDSVKNIKLAPRANIVALNKRFDVWEGISNQTVNGDCGTLLVANSEYGTCIIGIHILGSEDKVVATKVCRDDIMLMMRKKEEYAVGANPPILQSSNENRQLTKLHPKSIYRYVEDGHANIYGSLIGFRPCHKTKVEDTPMKRSVEEYFNVKVSEVSPDMSYKPWRYAALDLCNIPNNIDTSIVDKCVKSFAEDILKGLSSEDLRDLHKYDQFTSVNGAEGVRFVDKINRNTSAGFPFKKSKKYYIEDIPAAHGLADPVAVNKEIQEQIDSMMDRLKHYEMSGCVFNAHLKDEPVSQEKKKIGKTRVFSGANFPWTIITRKYLLSFVRVLQNNNTLFEAAIGVNHFSLEWENFYTYLTTHGEENCIAGDYKKFDKRMSPIFILAAFDFIIIIIKRSNNYTDEDIRIIRCLAYDIAFAYQDYNGDLVQFFGGNPSGHSLTVIINGIVNSLYMRYSYYNLNPKKDVSTFKENVNLLTYGDDNVANVSPSIPWFNHTSISEDLSNIGVGYTMADKEAQSVPYIHIDNCSFLKRTWRFDQEIGAHVSPLDLKSIFRSLSVWVRSKSITIEEQMIEIITAANAEFFLYGRDIFIVNQQKLKTIVKELKLTPYLKDNTFMSYDELIKRYKGASE